MGAFVSTRRTPPPRLTALMVRSGGSVFFAAHSLVTGWQMLANGRETAIPPPAEWWDPEATEVFDSTEKLPQLSVPSGQLTLDFSDCKTQSRRAA